MTARRRLPLLAAGGALLLAGCTASPDGPVCTTEFVYGVVVAVTDSASGAPLAGAAGAVRDGGYVDSLRTQGSSTLLAAGERAGTYSISVTRPGYRPYTRTGLVVSRDACHVQSQRVSAALAPDR